jgi:hypothetical protein
MIELTVALATAGAVLGFALVLTAVARLGRPGRVLVDFCARAPLLDVVVALLSWIPWVVGAVVAGWTGLGAVMVGQVAGLVAWSRVHELIYREAARGPRIVKALNGYVGRVRNHAALWVTAPVLPAFWAIRLAQMFLYPMLVMLLGFPRYRGRDWISVSRHKFEGLVGHDLVWCLYCDWMTGVYALGAEMLRNVESFWCPIRFYDGKKCENCRLDFPDIDGGWVPADGTMSDVTDTLKDQYGDGRREWFGHPARLTVKGSELGSELD